MKKILTPSRHGAALQPYEKLPTEAENARAIARGRRALAKELVRRFPGVKVVGISGRGELLVELPDDEALLARIKTELDCESGPAPDEPKEHPVWHDLPPTREAASRAHTEKEYRPTIVAIVRDH